MLQIPFVVGCHNITTTRTGGVMKETNGRLRIGKFWYPLDYDYTYYEWAWKSFGYRPVEAP